MKKVMTLIVSVFLLMNTTGCCTKLNTQTLNNKAKELMELDNVDGAICRLESINDLDPNIAENYFNLAIAYHKKGKIELAVQKLNKAISLKKDFADAYYTLGIYLQEIADKYITKEDKVLAAESLSLAIENFEIYKSLIKNPDDIESVEVQIHQIKEELSRYQPNNGKTEE